MAPDSRLDKLEKDQERIATLVMQIVTYMDNQQKSGQQKEQAFGNTVQRNTTQQATSTGGLAGIAANLDPNLIKALAEIAKAAQGFLGGGQEQQRDPFELEIYKGMRESFVEGFKTYIADINQRAQVGAWVIDAIKKGTLKLDAGAEKAAET